jgi:hypothetical protein
MVQQAELRPRLERQIRGRHPEGVLRLLAPTARIPDDPTVDQLRTAFKRALAKLHPDRTQYAYPRVLFSGYFVGKRFFFFFHVC